MVSPELLRRHRFFGGLKEDELAGVAMIAREDAYKDGDVIFREGDTATRIYVLTSGSVDLLYEIHRPGGADVSYVGHINTGEPFGISAFVDPFCFTATAKASGPVKVISIDADGLRAMSEVQCHVGYTIMRQVATALAERLNFARIQLAACD